MCLSLTDLSWHELKAQSGSTACWVDSSGLLTGTELTEQEVRNSEGQRQWTVTKHTVLSLSLCHSSCSKQQDRSYRILLSQCARKPVWMCTTRCHHIIIALIFEALPCCKSLWIKRFTAWHRHNSLRVVHLCFYCICYHSESEFIWLHLFP